MKYFYNFILLCIITFFSSVPEYGQIKIIQSKYIPFNTSFEISLLTKNLDPSADKIDYYIYLDNNTTYQKAEIRSSNGIFKLNFNIHKNQNYNGNVYKAVLTLKDSIHELPDVFQIIILLKSSNNYESEINYIFKYKRKDKIVKEISSFSDNESLNNTSIPEPIRLQFYKPQKNTDKCLSFKQNSSLRFSVNNNFTNEDFKIDFWIKLQAADLKFLRIINKENSKNILSFGSNYYQMFTIYSDFENPEMVREQFLSKKIWYHFSFVISLNQSELRGYCNENLIFYLKLKETYSANQLKFEFLNRQSRDFFLDQLTFEKIRNAINLSDKSQSNYSDTYFNMNFNNTNNIYNQFDQRKINFKMIGCESVKSDIPIFLKIPEINITLYNQFYLLEWTEEYPNNIRLYELEKSNDGLNFFTIKEIISENEPLTSEKKYSYLDKIEIEAEIVYYRLKEIDMNDKANYSSVVKIGQGVLEQFLVEQNYPNPFNPSTSFIVELLENTYLKIIIYNLVGKQIITLNDSYLPKGKYTYTFNGENYPSGIYFCEVSTPLSSRIMKMILAK